MVELDRSMAYRVVIVEDHPESAEGLAELVTMWGCEPHLAQDADRALHLVEAVDPHMVISDIRLPGMDGYELARRIRNGSRGAGIVLVALSGWSGDDDGFAGSGFDHRLEKPVDLDALERLLATESKRIPACGS